MSDNTFQNPYAHLSDDEIVSRHSREGSNSHYISEMMRRQTLVSQKLGDRIWWLNLWLLVFTIVIAVLTGALLWSAIFRG